MPGGYGRCAHRSGPVRKPSMQDDDQAHDPTCHALTVEPGTDALPLSHRRTRPCTAFTCPVLFQRLDGATRTLSAAGLEDRLGQGLTGIDPEVVAAFAELLPAAVYFPMLLQVTPRLVTPVAGDDYFAHEQVATWGVDSFWGLTASPAARTSPAPTVTSHRSGSVPAISPPWSLTRSPRRSATRRRGWV